MRDRYTLIINNFSLIMYVYVHLLCISYLLYFNTVMNVYTS